MVAILAEAISELHEVELLHHRVDLTLDQLAQVSGTDLGSARLRYVAADPYSFGSSHNPRSRYREARSWHATLSKPYDLFINFTHHVPPFCHAFQGVLVVLFPLDERPQILRALSTCLCAIICQRMIPAKTGGVVPALEILINTPIVRKLLEEGRLEKVHSAVEAGGEDGMQSFNQSIYKLIKSGLISEEDGIVKSSNPDQLKMNLKGIFLDESRRIIG